MVDYYPPLSALASQQSNPIKRTMTLCKQFLDYVASQDEAVFTYKASNMVLAIHSDASYLSKPKARSRAGGHMFMASNDEIPKKQWSHSQHLANNPRRNVLCSGGQTWRPLHQCKGGRIHTTNSATADTDSNGQFHRPCPTHQQDSPKDPKSHGHEIQLATMPRGPRTILLLLEARNTKLGGLLYRASPRQSPQIFPKPDSDITVRPRVHKIVNPKGNKY
jgi:hypothetical protein